jgi:hypothetical protein
MVDPVDPFGPCYSIATLLEYLMKLLLGRGYLLFLGINDQIVILGEYGYK